MHYLDYGGPAGAPVIVAVHGLEGCAVNWSALAPLLTGRYRLLAPDLAGHGLTRSAGRGVDVAANRVLLHRFIEAVAGVPGDPDGQLDGRDDLAARGGRRARARWPGSSCVDPALPFMPSGPIPRWSRHVRALRDSPGWASC